VSRASRPRSAEDRLGSPAPTRTTRLALAPCRTVVLNRWSGPKIRRAAVAVTSLAVEAGIRGTPPRRDQTTRSDPTSITAPLSPAVLTVRAVSARASRASAVLGR
jgi:hypothetical protein